MPTLFDPLKVGDLELPNRIVMAPLTRNRSSGTGRVPNAMMRDYYVPRVRRPHHFRSDDGYGGSVENRARLMLEVTDAVVAVWGPGRVGMHLAPRGDSHDMGDSDLPATFGYVARELRKRGIALGRDWR